MRRSHLFALSLAAAITAGTAWALWPRIPSGLPGPEAGVPGRAGAPEAVASSAEGAPSAADEGDLFTARSATGAPVRPHLRRVPPAISPQCDMPACGATHAAPSRTPREQTHPAFPQRPVSRATSPQCTIPACGPIPSAASGAPSAPSGQPGPASPADTAAPRGGDTGAPSSQPAAGVESSPAAPAPPRTAPPRIAPPRIIAAPGMDYPGDAFRLTMRRQDLGTELTLDAAEGTVALRALVLADGTVRTVEVVAPSGSPVLDRTAADAVRRWHFAPATRDGVPIDAYVTLRIRYVVR